MDVPSLPPPNTVVVLPKPLPINRGALWVLFWSIGILMGLFVRDVVDGGGSSHDSSSGAPGSSRSLSAQPTSPQAILVTAIVAFPTATATATPQPTTEATPDVDMCGTATPGTICRIPPPTPLPPTPYPSCVKMDELAAGDWCTWPTVTVHASEDRK